LGKGGGNCRKSDEVAKKGEKGEGRCAEAFDRGEPFRVISPQKQNNKKRRSGGEKNLDGKEEQI